jgi:hypothetical protein
MLASANDPSPLQDICVADLASSVKVNGSRSLHTLHKGDVFVFSKDLEHFQLNVGRGPALAFAGFNSQSPGLLQITPALFNFTPPVRNSGLRIAFRGDQIHSHFSTA